MLTRHLIRFAPALLLAACQSTTYHVEQARTYTDDKQVVWDNLMASLQRNELEVTSSDFASGSVAAERLNYQDQGWADCERRRVTYDRRMSWALRMDRSVALHATVTEAGSVTRATVDAHFTERQDDPNSFRVFTQPCRSTGALEKALLDSLGSPAGASPPQDTQTQ